MSASIRIPSLDGLRCLAIALVIASHAFFDAGFPSIIPGNLGVTIFFFLSGYLIGTLLRLEYQANGSISLRKFYARRALRIFPPMYIALALAVLWGLYRMSVFNSPPMDWWLVLGQALHVTNYPIAWHGFDVRLAPGTDIFWSLAVEEHFYLLYPMVFLLVFRLGSARQQAIVLLGICAAILAWRCVLIFGMDARWERTYVATDTRADSILFGCVLSLWGNPALDSTSISERRWKWLWFPLGVGALAATVLVQLADAEWFLHTFRYSVQGLALFPIFVVAVRYPDWGPMRLLNLQVVQWIGTLSYALYLVHRVCFELVWLVFRPPVPVYVLSAVALAFVIAIAIHRLVELPAARVRKRLSSL
ncbi:MAG: acyltransferase [Steroidobacteraceae bacterium]